MVFKSKGNEKRMRGSVGFWQKVSAIFCYGLLGMGIVFCGDCGLKVQAVHSIVYSPDHSAWTVREELPYTDHYNAYAIQSRTPTYWYPDGTTVVVGEPAMQLVPEIGQHVYSYRRMGEIPLWKWEVGWSKGRCIHTGNAIYWHGMRSTAQPCQNAYFSGWKGYCSDCGKQVTTVLVYMSKEAAGSITQINTGQGYFYHCPTCRHLENQCDKVVHICQAVSANQYKIIYEKNATFVRNHMDDSLHMYDNVTVYEGEDIVPVKKLRKNVYERDGYSFAGWNDRPDGKGNCYTDGQEILNLCTYDHHQDGAAGEVHLYAQWTPCSSKLTIDPNGGKLSMDFLSVYGKEKGIEDSYDRTSPLEISGEKGEKLEIAANTVIPPQGKMVSFCLDGGSVTDGSEQAESVQRGNDQKGISRGEQEILPIRGSMHFSSWQLSDGFQGKLTDQTYLFRGPDGHKDVIKALYEPDAIVLPGAKKENLNFGGWYKDPACTIYVGKAGDSYVALEDTILYAKWVELALQSQENLVACDGKGAVDLKWQQIDSADKVYRICISEDGKNFRQIQSVSDKAEQYQDETVFSFSGTKKTYMVEREGFYSIQAYGAQGGDWGEHTGGPGGSAKGKFYLQKGDVLTITVGGQNGYNGGGASTTGGVGGGASTVSHNGSYLVIAAGGGGATEYDNGKAGGESGVKGGFFYGENSETGGGGGGNKGGLGGSIIRHFHTATCAHQHTAECYTDGICGGTYLVEKVHVKDCPCDIQENNDGSYSYMGYALRCYGTIPGTHCEAHCELNPATRGHCVYDYYYTCQQCGDVLIFHNMAPDNPPMRCEKMTGTSLVCGYTQQFVCGYEHGAILSHSPAEGGDNYVSAVALDQTTAAGAETGDGVILIKAESVGFTKEMEQKGVKAFDKAAPDQIDPDSVKIVTKGKEEIVVTFDPPFDRGTDYWFQVESVATHDGTSNVEMDNRTADSKTVCKSNITFHTLTTGIVGYYYRMDEKPYGSVDNTSADNITPLKEEKLQCKWPKKGGYLHLAPVDMAGNVGETTHVQLNKQQITWKPSTEQMRITDEINGKDWGSVYGSDGNYYVRADGTTPFVLEYDSELNGDAGNAYQIDRQIICVNENENGEEQRLTTILPYTIPYDVLEDTLDPGEFESKIEGPSFLSEYSYAKADRRDRSGRNHFEKGFTMDASLSGMQLFVSPGVGASWKEKVHYSEETEDRRHGLWLLPDGDAPLILGMELLEELNSYPKEEEIQIRLTATDILSGLQSFQVVLSNPDLHYERTLVADGDGTVEICLPPDDAIRQGDFAVRLEAVDHVGNQFEKVYGASGFELKASIRRTLEPHEPRFKGGESGILLVNVDGYVERLEILFPENMEIGSSENRKGMEESHRVEIFYGEDLQYVHVEEIPFVIPLYMPPGEAYPVKVRAYKKGQMLESIPTLAVKAEASVLGEIRTRLR